MTCDEKQILYNNQWWPVQWLDLKEAPKHFPKPNLHPKTVMVTVWWSAAGLTHYSFLNPNETITSEKYAQQINEIHWKWQHLCPTLGNRKGPIFSHDNAWSHITTPPTLQKLNELGYKILPHLPYSRDLLPTDYHFFKHLDNFLQGKTLLQPTGCKKCFPRVHQIPKHRFLHYSNKVISCWQICVDCNGSYFD